MKSFASIWICIFLYVVAATCAYAIGVPNLRIDDLVKASDVIVIAEVSEMRIIGLASPVTFHGQELQATAYSSDLLVRRTIKGVSPKRLTIKYAIPVSFVGYRGLHIGTRMVFLRRTGDRYDLADNYYPDFPAVLEDVNGMPKSVADNHTASVEREMLAVIASPKASPAEKSEVLRVDYAYARSEQTINALKDGVANAQDQELKQRLQGELIMFGDIAELPNVIELLLTDMVTGDQKIWLLYVLGNHLTDPRSISMLKPLLVSQKDYLRAVAVEALWHIADEGALPNLITALQDPDEKVRFYAVRALSDIANEPGWGGPGESEFYEHQQKYLEHWNTWARDRVR